MTDRELMQQALEALHAARPACFADRTLAAIDNAMTALRDRLAQPVAALSLEEEREACADIADQHASCEGIAQKIAAEIRRRK